MTKTETTARARTSRAWEGHVRWFAYLWAAVWLVYAVVSFPRLRPSLIVVWTVVEVALVVVLIALHERRKRA